LEEWWRVMEGWGWRRGGKLRMEEYGRRAGRGVGEERDCWEIVERVGKNWKSRGAGPSANGDWDGRRDGGGSEGWGWVRGMEEGWMDGEG
jgi:hypothetical protein